MGNLYFNAVTGAYTLKKMNAQDTEKILNKVVAVALAYGNKLSTDKEKLALEASNNTYLYEILSSKLVYEYFKSIVSQTIVSSKFAKAPKLNIMLSNFGEYKKAFEYIGVASGDCPLFTAETITTAYENSLLAVAKPVDAEDTLTGNEEDLDGFVFDTVDEDEESPEAEITDKQAGELDIRQESPEENSEESQASTESSEDEDGAEYDAADYKEKVDRLKLICGSYYKQSVQGLVEMLVDLYGPGFGAMPEVGLYVPNDDNVLVKMNSQGKLTINKFDENSTNDYLVFHKLKENIKAYGSIVDGGDTPKGGKNAVPELSQIMGTPCVLHLLHAQFQSANINSTNGLTSIRRFVKQEYNMSLEDWVKAKNRGNKVKISNLDVAKKWYSWAITNIIFDALVKTGKTFTPANAQEAYAIITSILNRIKNAVVVVSRDVDKHGNLILLELALLAEEGITEEKLGNIITGLKSITSSSASLGIKIVPTVKKTGVVKLQLIYNEKALSGTNLFAADVLPKVLEAGEVPSWSHVLLGRTEDNNFMFWDNFMDPSKAGPSDRCYTIYAGSRSGKGIMTSTLLASALCDGKQIFYTDGKPENGAALGRIAWETGKEAYVFNGTPEGNLPYDKQMEIWTNGVRTVEETTIAFDKLPKCLFESRDFTEDNQRKFLGVMRYLKSMKLCADVVINRAKGALPMNEWQIWVFDELTKMSENEKSVRELFCRYIKAKQVKYSATKDETKTEYLVSITDKEIDKRITPGDEKYDEGVAYIAKWLNWNAAIRSAFKSAAVIELGKSDTNLIFIFQNAKWLATDRDITTIGYVVSKLSSTKIVGKDALAPLCGDYGDGITMNKPWVAELNKGKWGISSSANLREANVTIFRPFNVYTECMDMKTKQLTPIANDHPDAKQYLKGYAYALLSEFGKNPVDILNSAYVYADEAVKNLGLASDLKTFIYDASDFGAEDDSNTLENLRRNLAELDAEGNGAEAGRSIIRDNLGIGADGEEIISNNPATAPVATSSSPSTINDQKNHMNGVMSAREFLTKDETTKGYTLQRIQNELPKLFKLDIRDNSTYGLRHLCYNLSILYVAGFWNRIPVENYNPNIKTFCIAYYNSWLNGSQKDQNGIPLNLDKIPSPDQVTDMARAKGMPLNPLAGGAQQGNNPVLNAPGDNNDYTEEESGTPFVIDENSLDDYDFDNQGSDNVMDRINEQARYVQESYGRSSTPEGANGEILINQPGSKIPAMALNNQNNLVVELKGDGKDEKLLFKLFNKSGYNEKMTDNILDDRRKSVIEAIKSRWGVNGVRVIRLENDELYVNGVMINIDKLKSPELGFRFNDIVRIEELLKTFRLTEKVEIDAVAFQSLVEVHYENVDVIVALFKIAPRLRVLVIQFSEGEPYDSIPRAKLGEFKKKIKKEIGAAEFKNRMKVATAIYNPRLGEKGVAGAHEAYKIAKSMGGNFVDALTAKHPSILKGTLYGALGAGALVGGLGLHAIGKAGNFFGNLGNKDK